MRRIGIAGPGAVALLGLLLACNEAGSGGGVPPAAQATPSGRSTAAAEETAVSQAPAATRGPAALQAPAAAQGRAVSQASAGARGSAVMRAPAARNLAVSQAPAAAQGPAVSATSRAVQDTPPVPGGRMGRGGMMGGRGMMGSGGMMGQGGMPGGTVRGQADTTAAPQVNAAAVTAADCPPISQALVEQGRTIFTRVGNCAACHGGNAQGTPIAPNLTDSRWLDTNGSYAGIAGIVRRGVSRPKRSPAPMPQKGGAALDAGQVCAVAAYVYSLSHTGG